MTQDMFGAPGQAPSARAEDRVKRDRWKRYLLPDPQTGEEVAWTRVSTIKSCIANTHNLEQWKRRQVARGLALRPDLLALAASVTNLPVDDKSARETLNDVCKQADAAAGSRAGANLGTAIHHATEALDRGTPLREIILPPPYDRDIHAYDQARRVAGMVTLPEHIERIVVIPELRIAGTLDRLTFWRGGRRIKDVKTGQDAHEYGALELAVQLGLYANASYMWNLDTEQYEPMPEVAKDWGILAHVPSGQGVTNFYPVNIAVGWEYAQLAYEVHQARKNDSELLGAVFVLDAALPAAAIVEHAAATQDERMNPAAAQLRAHRSQLDAALRTAASQEQLIGISKTVEDMPDGAQIWTDDLRALAAARWADFDPDTARADDAGREALSTAVRTAETHERLIELHVANADIWDDTLTAAAAARWGELATVGDIGGPSLFAKRILNARTREELGALYEEGIAAGEWTEEIGALGHAVMAAYVEPCAATQAPHGETLMCGCGYSRPAVLDG